LLTTLTVPVTAPNGTETISWVAEAEFITAVTPPNVTVFFVVSAVKPFPVIVTTEFIMPVAGLIVMSPAAGGGFTVVVVSAVLTGVVLGPTAVLEQLLKTITNRQKPTAIVKFLIINIIYAV
jgi:hypothetical protein